MSLHRNLLLLILLAPAQCFAVGTPFDIQFKRGIGLELLGIPLPVFEWSRLSRAAPLAYRAKIAFAGPAGYLGLEASLRRAIARTADIYIGTGYQAIWDSHGSYFQAGVEFPAFRKDVHVRFGLGFGGASEFDYSVRLGDSAAMPVIGVTKRF